MDLRDVVLFLSAAIDITLSGVIIFHNPKSRANVFYSLAALSAALWAVGIVLFRLADFSAGIAIARFYYLSAALIALFFLEFALSFPEESAIPWSPARTILLALPLALITALLSSNLFIAGYTSGPWGKHITLGPGYLFYAAYFLGYVGIAFSRLAHKLHSVSGIARAQIGYVLAGVGVAMFFGVWFNLLLPFLGNYRLIWVGPPFTVVMVAFIAYAIFKHNLYNIKVIATEAFGAALALVLLVRLFTSTSVTELLLNTLILIAAAVIVVLLIRSVLAEVKTRERITELAVELERSNEELKKLDAAKSEFISLASHQLRAPLTVIKGFVAMLLEGALGPVSDLTKESMRKVSVSAEQLIRLVADMLDLSRIEAGRMKYDFKPVLLDTVVEEVVGELEPAAKAKGLAFRFENRNTAHETVRADSDKIREVVFNLIDNAIKYTASGRVLVELSPEVRDGRPAMTFAVRDTGIGISQAEIGKIFTKFARTEEAKRIRADGLGLGLYVVKKIVDDHGGKAWVESPGVGKGSAFFVSLPPAGEK